jgi:hypothetical protein
MKITKKQLRQIIKEEIHKQLLSEEQLDEGLGAKALLGVMLAMTGMGTAAIVRDNNITQEIQQALEAASPDDLEQAQAELAAYLGSCNRQSEFGTDRVAAADDWIGSSQKGGTGGFYK